MITLREELVKYREHKLKGVLLRSKARWVEDGERVTSYFCSLEKRHYINKTMNKLTMDNDRSITDKSTIRQEVRNFYFNLYSKKDVDDVDVANLVHNLPCLSDNDAQSLEGELSYEEISIALKNMKNGKSPGSDGFPVEFFKFFWKKIGYFVLRSLNEGFRKGHLSTTQKEGIIICIPKTDKSRDKIKNWRPISLLNTVYKIGSASIANRIKTVLTNLIHEDQTGFISGRYIGDNIRLIYDIISYVTDNNMPGILLCLDFEKAFDSVDWGFMFKTLKLFGFKQDILKWISTFYNNLKSTVLINGHTSDWFDISRGCRQGDPISPYLFVLCAEIMANMIRENDNIKGISINNREFKLSQYADDSEIMLQGDRESFEQCFTCIDIFGKVSGLKLNITKTSATWLGSTRNSNIKYTPHLDLQWNPEKFKILGIWFTNDLSNMVKINYKEKFQEILILYKIWLKRQLTPFGRVAILKSLILSKLIFLWILLPNPPTNMIEEIQASIFTFIWGSKNDKISRTMSVQTEENGGLGIPDIKTYIKSLKLSWIKKVIASNLPWKSILTYVYPESQKVEYVGCKLPKSNKLNAFWKNVFYSYEILGDNTIVTCSEEALAEPIFYNNRFKIGGVCYFYERWYEAGIRQVKDLLDDNGHFFTFNALNQKYNLNERNFFKHMQCIQSLRQFLRKHNIQIDNMNCCDKNVTLKIFQQCPRGSRLFYNIILSKQCSPKFATKWEAKLQCQIDWKRTLSFVHKIKEVKLKWFQIRIVHRILGTNVTLYCMRLRPNNCCTFCGTTRENISHIFVDCTIVKAFLLDVKRCMVQCNIIDNQFTFDPLLLLFGYSDDNGDETFMYVMLVVRFYIYKCRCEGSQPVFVSFQQYMKKVYLVQKQIARQNHVLNSFEDKWINWQTFIA